MNNIFNKILKNAEELASMHEVKMQEFLSIIDTIEDEDKKQFLLELVRKSKAASTPEEIRELREQLKNMKI